MTLDVPPFLTYVRSEFLYNLQQGFGYFEPAAVIGISIVKNDIIKFHILVDDKTLFNDIPTIALSNNKKAIKLEEDICNFSPCPSDDAIIHQYQFLTEQSDCLIWSKEKQKFQSGNYMFSVEFGKDQLHLIEMEDGNYTFWPNSLITWGTDVPENLPDFQ